MAWQKESTPTCSCGLKTNLKTSWTNRNPARRYLECAAEEGEGCGYWEWYDDDMCARSKQVIPGLLRKANRLEAENEELREEALRLKNKVEKLEGQVRKLKEEIRKKNKKNMLITVAIITWIILSISLYMGNDRKGSYFGRLQIAGY